MLSLMEEFASSRAINFENEKGMFGETRWRQRNLDPTAVKTLASIRSEGWMLPSTLH